MATNARPIENAKREIKRFIMHLTLRHIHYVVYPLSGLPKTLSGDVVGSVSTRPFLAKFFIQN